MSGAGTMVFYTMCCLSLYKIVIVRFDIILKYHIDANSISSLYLSVDDLSDLGWERKLHVNMSNDNVNKE